MPQRTGRANLAAASKSKSVYPSSMLTIFDSALQSLWLLIGGFPRELVIFDAVGILRYFE